MKQKKIISPNSKTLFVGIDWADEEHALCIIAPDGTTKNLTLKQDADEIQQWVLQTQQQFAGCDIRIAIEQSKGALVHALLNFGDLHLYPINPKQAANFRTALAPSGKKDDPGDAEMLALFLQCHLKKLRPWKPDSSETRQIANLSELRRKLVDDRKSLVLKLNSILKTYFPVMQYLFKEKLSTPLPLKMLKRWSDHATMKRVKPTTLKKFLSEQGMKNDKQQMKLLESIRSTTLLTKDKAITEPNGMYVVAIVNQILELNKSIATFDEQISEAVAKHPDEKIFRSLPGAGDALVPRLIAAMGSDRDRYQSAAEVSSRTGIAPITRSSGKSHSVKKRNACNKFLRQTFHEFAAHSRLWSDWAGAYYRMQKSKGKKHNAAVRALAYKWIRIIFTLWKNEKTYNEQHYLNQLKSKNSPIIKFLETS